MMDDEDKLRWCREQAAKANAILDEVDGVLEPIAAKYVQQINELPWGKRSPESWQLRRMIDSMPRGFYRTELGILLTERETKNGPLAT